MHFCPHEAIILASLLAGWPLWKGAIVATRRNFRDRRQARREAAEERAADRAKRGDAGQLMRLEQRGFGESREAERLRKKLALPAPEAVQEVPAKE